jgi:hypothetical protein
MAGEPLIAFAVPGGVCDLPATIRAETVEYRNRAAGAEIVQKLCDGLIGQRSQSLYGAVCIQFPQVVCGRRNDVQDGFSPSDWMLTHAPGEPKARAVRGSAFAVTSPFIAGVSSFDPEISATCIDGG